MHRRTFLTIVGLLGLVIGFVALAFPAVLLAGKGVPPAPAPSVWVREVGVLIIALSTIVLLVRGQPDTPAMRAVLWGTRSSTAASCRSDRRMAWRHHHPARRHRAEHRSPRARRHGLRLLCAESRHLIRHGQSESQTMLSMNTTHGAVAPSATMPGLAVSWSNAPIIEGSVTVVGFPSTATT